MTRFKVLTTIIIVFFFNFWGFWRRVDLLVDADVSEKHSLQLPGLEDGDSMFFRNVGIDQHINTAPKHKLKKYYHIQHPVLPSFRNAGCWYRVTFFILTACRLLQPKPRAVLIDSLSSSRQQFYVSFRFIVCVLQYTNRFTESRLCKYTITLRLMWLQQLEWLSIK
jgi:hypothetical protein